MKIRLFFLFFVVFVFSFSVDAVYAGVIESQSSTENQAQRKGFIFQHQKEYFRCIRTIDALLEKYRNYYTVDEKKRKIIITRELSHKNRDEIIQANRELTTLIKLFSKVSPCDYDYLEVKNVLLSLLQGMSHNVHTRILQPLGINALGVYDHVRKLLIPPALVLVGICLIVFLQKHEAFPQCSVKILVMCGAALAAAGIAYNYRDKISDYNHTGVDFAVLAKLQRDVEQALSS